MSSCHEKRPNTGVPSHARDWLIDLYTPNVAPCGSRTTAYRPTLGMSPGPATICPPNDAALRVVSSTSVDSTYGIQLGGMPCWRISSLRRKMPAIGTPPVVHMV